MAVDPTAKERMARKRERDRANGIVEVIVRVPKDRKEELRAIAQRMLEEEGP